MVTYRVNYQFGKDLGHVCCVDLEQALQLQELFVKAGCDKAVIESKECAQYVCESKGRKGCSVARRAKANVVG
jgi:tRNA(Phe) wybutosine-synthesizing methylase Tyw3